MEWIDRLFRWIVVALTGVVRWEGGDAARGRARMRPLAAGLLATVLLVAGCGDSGTGPAFDVVLAGRLIEAGPFSMEISDRILYYTRCEMSVSVNAAGGKAKNVAVFEGGTWTAGPGSANTGPVDLFWFVDVFGSDRVQSGNSLMGQFRYDRFGDSGYMFDLILRFRAPDGSLVSRPVSIPCYP